MISVILKIWPTNKPFLRLTAGFTFRQMMLSWDPIQVKYWSTILFHIIKKTSLINALRKLNQVFAEGMLKILLYFFKYLNLNTYIPEYMSFKHNSMNFIVEHENIGSLLFLNVKISRKNSKFCHQCLRKANIYPSFSVQVIS